MKQLIFSPPSTFINNSYPRRLIIISGTHKWKVKATVRRFSPRDLSLLSPAASASHRWQDVVILHSLLSVSQDDIKVAAEKVKCEVQSPWIFLPCFLLWPTDWVFLYLQAYVPPAWSPVSKDNNEFEAAEVKCEVQSPWIFLALSLSWETDWASLYLQAFITISWSPVSKDNNKFEPQKWKVKPKARRFS